MSMKTLENRKERRQPNHDWTRTNRAKARSKELKVARQTKRLMHEWN